MPIKVWDYLKEYENEKSELNDAITKVLESGWLILGENVDNFESEFSNYCGSKYGVGVNSGTDALFLGLLALGLKKGDEVITVSNTAVPTVSAIVSAGGVPRFVDIDPETYLMDVSKLEQAITKNTKCILPVHLYGQCVDMDVVNAIAKQHGLYVLEDCAQSHGAEYKGTKAGSMSDLSAFSFYPTKILGGYGDGGMVVTNSEEIRDKMKRLRFYGMDSAYYAKEHGYNSRLDELHAGILRKKLLHLDEYITQRRNIAKRYDELLSNSSFVLPKTADFNRHANYVYVVRHENRDNIIAELKKKDIFLNISYPWPIHLMSGYDSLGYKKGDFPNTEKAANEIFSLPMYPTLALEEQDVVVEALSKY